MINFNEPVYVEKGIGYITEAILKYRRLNGDGEFTKLCTTWFQERYGKKVLFTTSCTHALEMAALLCDIQPGDEVDYAIVYICFHGRCICTERCKN